MVERGGGSAPRSGEGINQYSTADYCESPDSASVRRGHPRPHYRPPTVSRCPRKCYRLPIGTCFHQPKTTHSFPNRRSHRSGRRVRRSHAIDETTSMDEHKSITSYSSMLTVDVSREMEAVNRDIEEIIRRCDHYCVESFPTCCHRTTCKKERGLTGEQLRILSMKRPPLDRLKDVPLCLLKPRPPRLTAIKEKSVSAPHSKHKTSRDIRDIVEETDALLRNVYKELSKGKRLDEDDGCRCEGTRGVSEVRHATCLERYLGCQNKCRRLHENRWFKPKWKDVLEKCDFYKMVKPNDEKSKHFHDTNCISEPTASSCLVRTKKESQNAPRTRLLVDAGVNTETNLPTESRPDVQKSFRRLSTSFVDLDKKEEVVNSSKEHKYPDIDLQSVKTFANYMSDNTSATRVTHFKSQVSDRVNIDTFDNRTVENDKDKELTSLLLDRNMGLSLDEGSNLNTGQTRVDSAEDGIKHFSRDLDKSPDTFLSYDYSGVRSRSGYEGAGDSVTGQETSRVMFSQVISKIVKKPLDWALPPQQIQPAKEDGEKDEVDSATCLEIMKRLVDLMSRSHRNQIINLGEVPYQYARVSNMKQQHLLAILKEINSIQDLEFYLRNASVAKSRTAAT